MEVQQVCKDFIRLYCKGSEYEAIQARYFMLKIWGIDVDWHEMGYALDSLTSSKETERTGTTSAGMALYFVNP